MRTKSGQQPFLPLMFEEEMIPASPLCGVETDNNEQGLAVREIPDTVTGNDENKQEPEIT